MFFSFFNKLRAAHKKYSKYATSKPSNSPIKSNEKKKEKYLKSTNFTTQTAACLGVQ